MKVLFVVPNYEPAWAFGGVVRCLSTLCRGLAKIGVDVSVYTTNVDGCGGLLPVMLREPTDVGGVTVTYFSSTFGRNSVWDSRALVRKLKHSISEFDILYIAATWQWLGISAGRLAQKQRVPYVIGTHGALDSMLLKKGKLKKMLYWHFFLQKCIKYAAAIHMTTKYEKEQSVLVQSGYTRFVVPNGMLAETFSINKALCTQVKKQFKIYPETPVLIAVGRSDPKKRLDILLKSFSLVLKSFPKACLMIVGPDENKYAFDMKKLSNQMGLSDNVIWTGYRTGNDLKGCYVAADIFLLPSIDENFGLVVTEAMAVGLPVVISNRVGVADDVECHNAGIVTEVNAKQFGQAIVELLRDRSRLKKMGENARKAAWELYNNEKVAHLMLKAFEDILSQSRNSELLT